MPVIGYVLSYALLIHIRNNNSFWCSIPRSLRNGTLKFLSQSKPLPQISDQGQNPKPGFQNHSHLKPPLSKPTHHLHVIRSATSSLSNLISNQSVLNTTNGSHHRRGPELLPKASGTVPTIKTQFLKYQLRPIGSTHSPTLN